ncbi:hypothetical protein IWX75_001214 [Arthrobacter sp. CAN_A6]
MRILETHSRKTTGDQWGGRCCPRGKHNRGTPDTKGANVKGACLVSAPGHRNLRCCFPHRSRPCCRRKLSAVDGGDGVTARQHALLPDAPGDSLAEPE